jgi:hypothetical protein
VLGTDAEDDLATIDKRGAKRIAVELALRWTGAAMQEAAKASGASKAHKQLPRLKDALAKHKAKAVPSNEHLAPTPKAA